MARAHWAKVGFLLMMSAAGMAREGFQPWVTTYAVFAARRAYDFICLAIAEEMLDVKIVCALPGLTTGYGPSHQATEDLAMFRGMPNLMIVDPCDASEIEQADGEEKKARLVCDFLAGMTDGYAARMYKRLFTPDFGSIGDLIG